MRAQTSPRQHEQSNPDLRTMCLSFLFSDSQALRASEVAKETVRVQFQELNEGGLMTRFLGLRLFMPLSHLLKEDPRVFLSPEVRRCIILDFHVSVFISTFARIRRTGPYALSPLCAAMVGKLPRRPKCVYSTRLKLHPCKSAGANLLRLLRRCARKCHDGCGFSAAQQWALTWQSQRSTISFLCFTYRS